VKNEKGIKKTRWLGLEFCTNDAHADATLRILKRGLKWRSKAPEELVCENERKINSLTAAAREVAKHTAIGGSLNLATHYMWGYTVENSVSTQH